MSQAPSDMVLSDVEHVSRFDYGKYAVGMRLGTSEVGVPVFRMGTLNEGNAFEMYADYATLTRIKNWASIQLQILENKANG